LTICCQRIANPTNELSSNSANRCGSLSRFRQPNIDNQLVAESQSPNVQSETYAAGDNVRWCVKYLKPKLDNSPTEDVRNSICVPLVGTQNRVLGVIEARNKKTGGSFTEHDERVAVCLARVACSSVDRGNLFYRIEEWRESIETLLSFNATVNQQLEPSEMVSQLVANVTGFLDADGGAAIVSTTTAKLTTTRDAGRPTSAFPAR